MTFEEFYEQLVRAEWKKRGMQGDNRFEVKQ